MLSVASHHTSTATHLALFDDDEAPTLERSILLGEPCIVSHPLSCRDAALLALLELEESDALVDDDPITREFLTLGLAFEAFDESQIDALVALEQERECGIAFDITFDHDCVLDEPLIIYEELDECDEGAIDELLAPYVQASMGQAPLVSFRALGPMPAAALAAVPAPALTAVPAATEASPHSQGWRPGRWLLIGGLVLAAEVAATYAALTM